MKTSRFISIMTTICILGFVPFLPFFFMLNHFTGDMGGPDLESMSLISQFIFAVVIVPLLETLLFQLLPISLLRKFTGFSSGTVIIISSMLFGLQHCYSPMYILHGFLIGLVLAYSYIVYENRENSSYWVVCSIHSLRNCFSLVIINLF